MAGIVTLDLVSSHYPGRGRSHSPILGKGRHFGHGRYQGTQPIGLGHDGIIIPGPPVLIKLTNHLKQAELLRQGAQLIWLSGSGRIAMKAIKAG
ncbi:hypothetical protein Pyn_11669 [Prunus yedoensis var. nudiflora]|uniref:Uncharacterized protein n=1 Tax=Prunus yedoensis var. nudiflora TaxID=2094558 RepID=A0A314XQ28_PRUYE|nr:hypothetical protein Pyn_11669 [Prunus yedoensis var. nudiflora]